MGARGELGRGSTRELLTAWCIQLRRPGVPEERRAAHARALASTGWSGVLEWLEARWTADGDEAALAGVLLAAGRGQVVPSLGDPGRVQALLAELDRMESTVLPGSLREERLQRRAEVLARALAEVGPTGQRGASTQATSCGTAPC